MIRRLKKILGSGHFDDTNLLEIRAEAIHHTDKYGDFSIFVVVNTKTDKEHVVLTKGSVLGQLNVLCRIASECLPGTALHSADCECKEQLDMALEAVASERVGMIIYLRQEGRGQGLTEKIRALANKNKGYDTFAAVELLGKKADVRTYEEAAEILKMFEVQSVRLMTNNPDKIREMEDCGVRVSERVPVEPPATEATELHLLAKKQRGHLLSLSLVKTATR